MNTLPNNLHIMEVGPRDGLQNESKILSIEQRKEFIVKLIDCGFRMIEIGAFVNPKYVPQMAHTKELLASLPKNNGAEYWCLVPNEKGFDLAMEAGATHVSFVMAITESMNQRNVKMTMEQSFIEAKKVIAKAHTNHIPIKFYLSVLFHCPFEGETPLLRGLEWVKKVSDLGVSQISLSDTDGKAHSSQVRVVLDNVLNTMAKENSKSIIGVHFHDTFGQSKQNTLIAFEKGIAYHDSSTAGLGGCPYSPGAKGNTASDMLIQLAHEKHIATGIDSDKLRATSNWIRDIVLKY